MRLRRAASRVAPRKKPGSPANGEKFRFPAGSSEPVRVVPGPVPEIRDYFLLPRGLKVQSSPSSSLLRRPPRPGPSRSVAQLIESNSAAAYSKSVPVGGNLSAGIRQTNKFAEPLPEFPSFRAGLSSLFRSARNCFSTMGSLCSRVFLWMFCTVSLRINSLICDACDIR